VQTDSESRPGHFSFIESSTPAKAFRVWRGPLRLSESISGAWPFLKRRHHDCFVCTLHNCLDFILLWLRHAKLVQSLLQVIHKKSAILPR
jgi:hypothetical protein